MDTYDQERRAHATAMIELNMTAGSIMKLGPRGALVRDGVALVLNLFPAAKRYFTEMRFKPLPRYAQGVVVDEDSGERRALRDPLLRRLVPVANAPIKTSAVGTQFIQPWVRTSTGQSLLDDVVGDWWVLAAWGQSPYALLSEADRARVADLGIRLVSFVPETQRAWAENAHADTPVLVVGDHTGRLKEWFDDRSAGVLFLRPDRFIAAACLAQEVGRTLDAVLSAARCPAPRPDRMTGDTR